MKSETAKLLAKASRAVEAARQHLQKGDVDFAASRAYYAMFYAAEALLIERELHFKKHSGVHAAFGEHFSKTGVLDPKFHRWLLDAFDLRLEGDYGFEALLNTEDVSEMMSHAVEFVEEARRCLGETLERQGHASR